MGRVNIYTDGVFTDIVGNQDQKPGYERFKSVQNQLKDPKGELKKLLSAYDKLINENKSMFQTLASYEELIMQLRVRDNIKDEDIKFNVVREYIYARVPFYRTDKDTKDVRVIVGLTEFYGTDINKMYVNKDFMEKAKEKIILAMDDVIQSNLEQLKKSNK